MSKKSWSIRKARADDAEALAACMDAAYRPYMERLGDAPLPPMTVDYHAEIASYPVWVVEADATVVGGLVLIPEGDGMTVANVAVHPHFQGHGVVLKKSADSTRLKSLEFTVYSISRSHHRF